MLLVYWCLCSFACLPNLGALQAVFLMGIVEVINQSILQGLLHCILYGKRFCVTFIFFK